jgi:hypothetical protein
MTAGQCKTTPVSGIAGDIYTDWTGSPDAHLLPIPVGSAARDTVAAQIQAIANAIDANSGGGGGGSYLGISTNLPLTGGGGGPYLALGLNWDSTALQVVGGNLTPQFGTTAGKICEGNDARITSALTSVAVDAPLTGSGTSGSHLGVSVGSTAGTVAAGNDSRIVNALASVSVSSPLSGNGTSGSPVVLSVGSSSGTVAAGDDSRIVGALQAPSSPAQGDVLIHDGSAWARLPAGTSGQFLQTLGAGANPSWQPLPAGISPFLFRLNPTSTAQFGTPRTASGGTPTVSALTDPSGRPFVRCTAAANTGICLIPLLDGGGNLISATGRFIVRALLRPTNSSGANLNQVIAWNVHRTTGTTYYGVGKVNVTFNSWDSVVSGTNEGSLASTQFFNDASLDFAYLYVDCYLNLTTGYCYYLYSTCPGGPFYSNFYQKRKTSLVNAGANGDAMAIALNGVSSAAMDIAELVVWKDEPGW